MAVAVKVPENRIFGKISASERRKLAADVEDISLCPGETICAAGERIRHVYFPRQGVISLFAIAPDASAVGVGLVGGQGMFGLAVAAGKSTSGLRAVSQGHGRGHRIEAKAFRLHLEHCPGLRGALFAYSQDLSTQLAQNAACMALHPARMRLARWMLEVTHGERRGSFSSTQAALATALGIQRAAVNSAAGALQRLGLIRYLRGEVTIIDRVGLVAAACACRLYP